VLDKKGEMNSGKATQAALLITVLILIGTLLFTGQAAIDSLPSDVIESSIFRSETFRDFNYTYTIESRDVALTPSWDIDSNTPPPFNLRDADKISREYLNQVLPKVKGWRLNSIELHSVDVLPNKWYYVLHYKTPKENDPGLFDWLHLSVLMSGKVVPIHMEKKNTSAPKK